MRLIEVASQKEWDAFQVHREWAQFTQSWAWGEMRRLRGIPIRRFAFVNDEGWKAAVSMEFRAKRFGGGYWFAPRGPVFVDGLTPDETRACFSELLSTLADTRDQLKLQRALFWRFEPPVELSRVEGLMPLAMRRGPTLNPASTLLLDLKPTLEEIQGQFHQKTRYNIRVAARHGVKIRLANSLKDVEAFLALMKETASRDGFAQHELEYLRHLVTDVQRAGLGRLRIAELNGHILAANLETFFGDTMTYLHGSSSSKERHAMAPFALHWQAIMQAKEEGYRWYDWWGLNPLLQSMPNYKKSWEGITRFKRGWGGRQIDLPGTWDLPFNLPLYRLAFLKQFWRG